MLGITGAAKVYSSFGTAKVLAMADPIAGISFRDLLLAVGIVELLIARLCVLGGNPKLATAMVAGLGTSFLVYRVGLWFIGWHRPCGCMGSLTDMLHISPRAADNIMKVLLAYLLVGSYAIVLWQWRRERATRGAPAPTAVPVREPETAA